MAKADKDYTVRMQGYVAAYDYAKKNGLEALEKDIRMRGFLRIPINVSQKEVDNFKQFLITNLYNTVLTVVCMTLHDTLGFGKKRLLRFKANFDKLTEGVFDFDYAGQHYVTLEDYAVYLNEKANLGLDVSRIAACQEVSTTEKEYKDMADVKGLIKALRDAGFTDASEWLEGKVG
ncbi:MAG: hypothetical protein IJZ53_07475 [Tyzzerella sp.]|nr:hypothetical protein [Tyzzerella sp.]